MPDVSMFEELTKLLEKQEEKEASVTIQAKYKAHLLVFVDTTTMPPRIVDIGIYGSAAGSICADQTHQHPLDTGLVMVSRKNYQDACDKLEAHLQNLGQPGGPYDWVMPWLMGDRDRDSFKLGHKGTRYQGNIYADEEMTEVLQALGVVLGSYDYMETAFRNCEMSEWTLKQLHKLPNVSHDIPIPGTLISD
jgi:hypothetical protein